MRARLAILFTVAVSTDMAARRLASRRVAAQPLHGAHGRVPRPRSTHLARKFLYVDRRPDRARDRRRVRLSPVRARSDAAGRWCRAKRSRRSPPSRARAYDEQRRCGSRGPDLPNNPALWTPAGYSPAATPGAAAVFFIHPTSYISRSSALERAARRSRDQRPRRAVPARPGERVQRGRARSGRRAIARRPSARS